MNQPLDPMIARLEAHLDRAIEAPHEAAREPRLSSDGAFCAEVDRQRAIDDSLRRVFQAVDPRIGAGQPIEAESPLSAPLRINPSTGAHRLSLHVPHRRRWALAAAMVAAVSGGWLTWHALMPAAPDAGPYDQAWRSFEIVYRDVTAAGFEPGWVCKDEREFAEAFDSLYGQPLRLAPLPNDVAALGLAYSHSLSPRTTCLLVRAAGEPVLVFIDRAERDFVQAPGESSGLRLFRAPLGKLVLYELTPLDRPSALQHFVLARGDDVSRVDGIEEIRP